jgi:hypothetical protein
MLEHYEFELFHGSCIHLDSLEIILHDIIKSYSINCGLMFCLIFSIHLVKMSVTNDHI